LGAFGFGSISFHGGDRAETLSGSFVTADYFQLLGLADPGAFLSPDEEQAGVPCRWP
jgi:hypothetical protein